LLPPQDATELVAKLRAYHHKAQSNPEKKHLAQFGLDLINGKVRNNVEEGVLEPAMSKTKMIQVRCCCCCCCCCCCRPPPPLAPHHCCCCCRSRHCWAQCGCLLRLWLLSAAVVASWHTCVTTELPITWLLQRSVWHCKPHRQ
jgi:hypothetical protein